MPFGARVVNPAYSSLLIVEGMLLNPDAFSMTADVNQSVKVREIKLWVFVFLLNRI